ncbi:HAD-IC family P-type ATPase [Streptomyces sp. GC420]|nr:HAD-IC family P-type ATPase [Streptomyces sp. GC420]
MDRGVLRRLGQMDTVVLDESALRGEGYELADLGLVRKAEAERCAERAFSLFDPQAPGEIRRDGEWVLGPLERLDPSTSDGKGGKGGRSGKGSKRGKDGKDGKKGPGGRKAAARLRRRGAEQVLGLTERGRLRAVASVTAQSARGAEAVVAAARRSGVRIVLATGTPDENADGVAAARVPASGAGPGGVRVTPAAQEALARAGGTGVDTGTGDTASGHAGTGYASAAHTGAAAGTAAGRKTPGGGPGSAAPDAGPGDGGPRHRFADATVPGGDRLVASVRELQAGGAVVLLVSGNRRALVAADCGVGVHPEGKPPAWGAHLLVGADLATAGLLVDAVGVAAQVDRESVMLASGGSGVGAVAALQAAPARASSRSAAAGNAAGTAAFCLAVWRARQLLSRPPDETERALPWHLMPVPRVLEHLDASEEGLSDQDAKERKDRADGSAPQDGPRATTLPVAFAEELANPLTPVLAAGAALAAAVGSRTDAGLVAAVTGVSALAGGVQRVRTDRALAELFERSAIGARVRRGGRERLITAGDLVPGDIVLLRPEDVVPADCRVLEAEGVEVDESSLTGESLPVSKNPAPVVASQIADRRSMLYEGTSVAAGRGTAVVVATGAATEVGRSLAAAGQAAPTAGVEARLTGLTRASMPVALGSAAAVSAAGLLHGRSPVRTLSSAVNLAVASVPEGLPFLVGAAQMAAARRLADRGALVRNPRTIEALGRADVLCFDKTGTLTEGTLRLAAVSDGDSELPVDRLDDRYRTVLAAALRATPPARESEPLAHHTDRAVAAGARRAHVAVRHGASRWRRTDALPFEPLRAYHATAGQTSHGMLLSVKGAPENVLERCTGRRADGSTTPLDAAARQELTDKAQELAGAGRRVLAVAERTAAEGEELTDESVRDLVLLGFLALSDPVRAGAAPAAARLLKAGVQIVMLTGDHPATADAIATTVHRDADQKVCTGAELDELDDDRLDALLPTVDVIARCSPHHKVRIVQAYQRLGRVVAMTGDGANDAPAIRLADVGIALGRRGTPAATAAADLVVSDDRLETIISALMEGRAMWVSVRSALAILIGGNFGEITFNVLAAILTGGTPLGARQLMLVNLLTDLAPALAIAVREPTANGGERLLREGPDRSLGEALRREMLLRGATTALGAGLAWGAARFTGRARRAGTVALVALVGTQLAQTLFTGVRDRKVLLTSLGSAAALAMVVQTPGLSGFFGCTPLGPVGWGIAVGAIASAMALGAALNPVARRLLPREGLPGTESGDAELSRADVPSD